MSTKITITEADVVLSGVTMAQAQAWRDRNGIGSAAICGEDADAVARYIEVQAAAGPKSARRILAEMTHTFAG